MQTGIVKWFNAQRFCFIQPDAGGADIFVHISAVERAGCAASPKARRFRTRSWSTTAAASPRGSSRSRGLIYNATVRRLWRAVKHPAFPAALLEFFGPAGQF